MSKKSKEQKSLEGFSQCAFCGEKTRYFFYELNCHICVVCLARYNREKTVYNPVIFISRPNFTWSGIPPYKISTTWDIWGKIN